MFDRDDLMITSSSFDDYIGVRADNVEGYGLSALVRATNISKGLSIEDKDEFYKKTHIEVRYPDAFAFDSDARYTISVKEGVESADIDVPDGFVALDGTNGTPLVNKFLSQIAKTKVFVNESAERAYIFVHNISERWVRNLTASWPMIAKWDFKDPKGAREMSAALSRKTTGYEEIFAKYINDLSSTIDFRNIILVGAIRGMAAYAAESQLRSAKDNIEDVLHRIADCEDTLKNYTSEYMRLTALVKALTQAEAADDSAYVKCFSDRKNVTVTKRRNNDLYYYVADTLEYYDDEEFLRLYQKSSSYLYSNIEKGSDIAKALYCLFYKRVGEVVVSASFILNDGSFVKSQGHEMPRKDLAPQPHIYFYGCDGGNADAYARYARTGDFEMGVDQSISATKNINWGDSSVVPKFIEWLDSNRESKCITMTHDTNDVISIADYIERMKGDDVWPD